MMFRHRHAVTRICLSDEVMKVKAVFTVLMMLVSYWSYSQAVNYSTYLSASHNYFDQKKFKEAVEYADSARMIVQRSNAFDSLETIYRWLYEVHSANKDYPAALLDIQKAESYRDSIEHKKRSVAEAEWRSILTQEKDARQNEVQRHEEELLRLQAMADKNERNAITIFGGFFALSAIGIFALNRKRIEATRAREQTLRDLHDLQAFKEKLATVLSYDLTKSLSAFENLAQSLSRQLSSMGKEESMEFLRQLHATAIELKSSIGNVLHWIAYQAHTKPVYPVQFDSKMMAERALEKVQQPLKDKKLTSQVFIPENQNVFADPEMIEIVLDNLVSNAIHFMHAGGTLTCFSGRKDGLVLIGIRDTGIGISEEHCRKLFDAREDFHTIGSPSHKGAGVGLILAKDLVERNGGRIYVESTVGQGSTFYFTLPEKKID